MRTTITGLLVACLLRISYGMGGCPPVIMNGKLHGILPVVNQTVTYSAVVDCGAVSQADVFRRVRLWVIQSCQLPGDVVTLIDKETGDLAGRMAQVIAMPRSEQSAGGVFTFRYSLIVECTNRKYRATITQLTVGNENTGQIPIETYCGQNGIDVKTLYTALDGQLRNRLALLGENVTSYRPF